MKTYELSSKAAADFEAIQDRTFEKFGYTQLLRSQRAFYDAFENLALNPDIGRPRPDLTRRHPEFRFWTVLRRFVIVYEPLTDGVEIVRVLDGVRDLPRVLDDDGS